MASVPQIGHQKVAPLPDLPHSALVPCRWIRSTEPTLWLILMELPDDTPRLPKLPFLIGDLILLSVAAIIAYRMGSNPTTAEVVGIVVSTGLAVAVGLAPFVIGYARQQEIQLRDRERMVEKLVRSTASAADQASIAAAGLNEIAEKTKANLDSMDTLPATILAARKTAEAQTARADDGILKELREELAALQVEMVAQNNALGTRLDTAIAALSDSLQATVLNAAASGVAETEPKTETPEKPVKRAPRRKKADAAAVPDNEGLLFGGEIVSLETTEEIETADAPVVPPKRKRKPRRSAPSETVDDTGVAAATTEPDSDAAPAPSKVEPAPVADAEAEKPSPETSLPAEADEDPAPAPAVVDQQPVTEKLVEAESAEAPTSAEEPAKELSKTEPAPEIVEPPQDDGLDEPPPAEPALSSDGLTRLTVTAYIGIGNRLFIRGEGPGLSRDEGIPLQFVSIGKWRWETDAASEPVKVTLWKNDEEACTSAGEITLQPGSQLEQICTKLLVPAEKFER